MTRLFFIHKPSLSLTRSNLFIQVSFELTGNGDVLEPKDGIMGVGSGGPYALAAARALADIPDMDAETIARKAMSIAADMCVYTNGHVTIESLDCKIEETIVQDSSHPK